MLPHATAPALTFRKAHMSLAALQTFVIAKDGTCVFTYRDQLGAEKHVQVSLQCFEMVV